VRLIGVSPDGDHRETHRRLGLATASYRRVHFVTLHQWGPWDLAGIEMVMPRRGRLHWPELPLRRQHLGGVL
jgi:hypothetical protein